MHLLTIFIICHNRPEDAKKAILSALSQSDLAYCLKVSDNSSNDDVKIIVENSFQDIDYVKRDASIGAFEHFNLCIDESISEYVCLFHDDDLLQPDFIEEIKKAIFSYPNAIAIGCNAHIERHGKLEARQSFKSASEFEIIKSEKDLATRYFAGAQSGIAPFPGYVYKKQAMKNNRFRLDGGKYSDVSWLLELIKIENIIWVNKPLMTYRLHASNDGNIESRRDRLKFLAYLKKNIDTLGIEILHIYRFGFLYKNMGKQVPIKNQARYLLANKFLLKHRLIRLTKTEYYKSALNRIMNRFLENK
jgi:glycosyltransferase involved in cell wall biosynthesis